MEKDDSNTNLREPKDLVAKFRNDRGWGKHHTPKNLAMSIAIEAAELMELFPWDEYTKRNQGKISDELADILIFCFNLADTLGVDIATSFSKKLKKAEEKYPTDLFNAENDSPDHYNRIKHEYRRKKHEKEK